MVSDIAVTQIISFASLVFTGVLGYFMFQAKSKAELALANVTAVAAVQAASVKKVDEIAIAQVAVVDKTDAAAEKMVSIQQKVDDRSEKRGQQIDAVAAKVDAVAASLGNGIADTLKAVVAKVDHAVAKVETVATTAGVAVNRVNDVRRALTVQAVTISDVASAQAADGAKIVEAGEKFEKLATSLSVAQVKVAVDEVKAAVTDSAKTGDANHTLLNSGHGVLLASLATAQRALTKLDPSPENITKSEAADKQLAEHEASQKIVDAGKKIEARP